MCIVNYRRAQWTVSTPCPCGLTNRGPGTGSDGAVDEKIDGGEGGGTVNTKLARRCDSGISRVATRCGATLEIPESHRIL